MEEWDVLAVDTNAIMRFKNEGKEIQGVRLLLRGSEPAGGEKDRYIGFNWHDQFISNERLQKLQVRPMPGQHIKMYFNRYGDIINIEVA